MFQSAVLLCAPLANIDFQTPTFAGLCRLKRQSVNPALHEALDHDNDVYTKVSMNVGHDKIWVCAGLCSKVCKCIWPASHEKGPSDISHSLDQDQPL